MSRPNVHLIGSCVVVCGVVSPHQASNITWGAELLLEQSPLFILRNEKVLEAARRRFPDASFVLAGSIDAALLELNFESSDLAGLAAREAAHAKE